MAPPSLLDIATRSAIANVDFITDFAEMPYELARPILKHIKNPDRLHEIETRCPHIADRDAELWKIFISRDIPNMKKLSNIPEPVNPRSWWKVYRKLSNDAKAAAAKDEDVLRRALQGANSGKAKSLITDKIMHVPCEEVAPGKFRKFKDPHRIVKPKVKSMRNAKTGREQIQILRLQAAEDSRLRGFRMK